jgi:hypothetical protein
MLDVLKLPVFFASTNPGEEQTFPLGLLDMSLFEIGVFHASGLSAAPWFDS